VRLLLLLLLLLLVLALVLLAMVQCLLFLLKVPSLQVLASGGKGCLQSRRL